MSREELEYFC